MDRYTRIVLTIIAGALLVIAFHLTSGALGPAHASQEPPKSGPMVCNWSYVSDSFAPEVGEVGAIKMDSDWSKMSTDGWHLVTVVVHESKRYYLFEKCGAQT